MRVCEKMVLKKISGPMWGKVTGHCRIVLICIPRQTLFVCSTYGGSTYVVSTYGGSNRPISRAVLGVGLRLLAR